MTGRPTRILVVDDHDLLREGVSACLAAFEDLEVVGEAPNGEAAIESVAALQPDVVVIDLVMPGIGGVEAIRVLRVADAALGIVALSSYSDADQIRDAIEAGANGYLVKSVDSDSLARAVRSAAAGQSAFSPGSHDRPHLPPLVGDRTPGESDLPRVGARRPRGQGANQRRDCP